MRQVVSGLVTQRTNRQIVLRRRPTGLVAPDDVELIDAPAPNLAEGEALVRTTYIGMDAAARTWLDDQPGYLPPVQIGEVIRGAGIGEVVESRCPAYAVGDEIGTVTKGPIGLTDEIAFVPNGRASVAVGVTDDRTGSHSAVDLVKAAVAALVLAVVGIVVVVRLSARRREIDRGRRVHRAAPVRGRRARVGRRGSAGAAPRG